MQNLNGLSKNELRKSNKPIMEKRRRARINHCLNELKSLILEAMKKDPARHSKLEKADILEMTVKHLQSVQRKQLSLAIQTDPTVIHKFKTGFTDCAAEVNRYLCQLEGMDPVTCKRLTNHLNNCATGIEQIGTFTNFSSAGYHRSVCNTSTSSSSMHLTNDSVFCPPASSVHPGDLNNNNNNNNGININEIHLIPSRLPSGELALIMPKSNSITSPALFLPTIHQQPSAAAATPPAPLAEQAFYYRNAFPRFSAFTKPPITATQTTASPPLSPVSSISSLGDDSMMHTSSDFPSKSSSSLENSLMDCYAAASPKLKTNNLLAYTSYLQQSLVSSTSELSKLDESLFASATKRSQSVAGLDDDSTNRKPMKLVKNELSAAAARDNDFDVSNDDDDDDTDDDDDDDDAKNGNSSNNNRSNSLDESMWRPW